MPDHAQKEFYAELGRRILDLRRKRGLSQTEFGQRMNPPVTRACVSSLELGTRRVHAHMLASIRDALQVSADELLPASVDWGAEQEPNSSSEAIPAELGKKLQADVAAKLAAKLMAKIRGGQ